MYIIIRAQVQKNMWLKMLLSPRIKYVELVGVVCLDI